jgi:hypothetical protein
MEKERMVAAMNKKRQKHKTANQSRDFGVLKSVFHTARLSSKARKPTGKFAKMKYVGV